MVYKVGKEFAYIKLLRLEVTVPNKQIFHSESCKSGSGCDGTCNTARKSKFDVTEADRAKWREEDAKKYEGFNARDEEIWEVMREDINRGNGYRRYMGKWASNDAT